MNLIRIGDDADHGGKVQTGLATMRFDGRPPCGAQRITRRHVDDGGRHPDRAPWPSRATRQPFDFTSRLMAQWAASKLFPRITPVGRPACYLPESDQTLQLGTKLVPVAADANG